MVEDGPQPHSLRDAGHTQAPIGQKLLCYNSGVPPNYYEKMAEGKEDIREQESTAAFDSD